MTQNHTRIWLVSVLNFSQIWGWRSYFFPKSQAGHVLKMFLNFWEISAWCFYKLGSYKMKKSVGHYMQWKTLRLVPSLSPYCLDARLPQKTGRMIRQWRLSKNFRQLPAEHDSCFSSRGSSKNSRWIFTWGYLRAT